jgi:hypothetical protein
MPRPFTILFIIGCPTEANPGRQLLTLCVFGRGRVYYFLYCRRRSLQRKIVQNNNSWDFGGDCLRENMYSPMDPTILRT